MAEQTSYLCTVLVDPSPSYISLSSSQEWFLQLFGLSRLSCKNTHNGTERTLNVTLENSPWIKLLRCSMQKVLGVTDSKSGSDSILAIRIFIQPNFYYTNGNSLEFLLQENVLQDILEDYPSNHVFVEYRILNCNDRTLRKQTRIAQDAFKARKITSDVSESCPFLVSQMLRQKERFCLPDMPLAQSMDLSYIDYSLSQDWKTYSVTNEPMTTKAVLPSCITIHASEVSFTESSLLLSWDVSCENTHPQVVTENALLLDQTMLLVQHPLSNTITTWIEKCKELGMSYANITGPQLPQQASQARVLFIESSKQISLQETAQLTSQTYTYMLRLQNDMNEPGIQQVASQRFNEQRAKKVQFSHLKKNNTLSDVPFAWCEFGIVVEDLRNLKGTLIDYKSPWKAHFVLRDGFGDCNVSSISESYSRIPKILHGLFLEPPKKWLRSVRLKHVQVSPEAALIKWAQILQKCNTNVMNPEDDLVFYDMDKTSICIRGNSNAIVSLPQAETLLDEHFSIMPKHSIGQQFQKIPGTLRKRSFSDVDPKDSREGLESCLQNRSFDCNICQDTYDFTKHAMTQTLCGHTFCIECGNQAFKVFQGNSSGQVVDGTKTMDCPCCRCSLSVFDILRIINDDNYTFNYVSNLEKALETERLIIQGHGPVTRRASQKVTHLVVSCEKDPIHDWYKSVEPQIHTLFVTHAHTGNYYKWQVQFLKWISFSKKTNKIIFFGNSNNTAILALKQLLN